VREAFYIARSGRPGPVLIDICKDAQVEKAEFVYPEHIDLRGYKPPICPAESELQKAVEMIDQAEKPVILAGHGIKISKAYSALRELAEKADIPVAMTLLGLGSFPASHPLALGMMGMHGEAYCNMAIQDADLIIALGMRFDDRVTGNLKMYAPRARKIHVEIDPSEIHKNVAVDLPLVGDLNATLNALLPLVKAKSNRSWNETIENWRNESQMRDILSQPKNGKLYTAQVIYEIWKETHDEVIVTTGVGQHQMWAAQYYRVEKPNQLITSGGAGTMGFGLPSAIGAWFANRDSEVWVIDGDGSFQMTQAELNTAIQEKANVKVAIMNNNFLGMVRQWQEFFFNSRYVGTPLKGPDFTMIAAAHGIPARRITRHDEVQEAISFARQTKGPVVLDFRVVKEDAVYPMVPTGAALDEMIRRPVPPAEAYVEADLAKTTA